MILATRSRALLEGALLGALLLEGCGARSSKSGGLTSPSEPQASPPESLTVVVKVVFTGYLGDSLPPSGGTAGVRRSDIPGGTLTTFRVTYDPPNSFWGWTTVPQGWYTLSYLPPFGYAISWGASPQTLSQTSGEVYVKYDVTPVGGLPVAQGTTPASKTWMSKSVPRSFR